MCSVRAAGSIVAVRSADRARARRGSASRAGEHGDVAGAREVAGRVEPVRPDEVGVGEPELLRLRVHQRDERGAVSARPRVASASAASLALWISAPASRSWTVIRSPGAQRDPRLADAEPRARSTVTSSPSFEVLERDEHGHQLRDAGDRHAQPASCAREHLAGRGVRDVPSARASTDGGARRRSRRPGAASAASRSRRDGGGAEQPTHRRQVT